jgi:hypothetical protein
MKTLFFGNKVSEKIGFTIFPSTYFFTYMWYLHTMEFYSAMKKNKILLFSSKWTELENIILSKVSQAQKIKNCMFSLIWGL